MGVAVWIGTGVDLGADEDDVDFVVEFCWAIFIARFFLTLCITRASSNACEPRIVVFLDGFVVTGVRRDCTGRLAIARCISLSMVG